MFFDDMSEPSPPTLSADQERRIREIVREEIELWFMAKRGTKAWADVPDNWLEELRGEIAASRPSAPGERP